MEKTPESLDRQSRRISLATLLMAVATPGVLALVGYFLVDLGFLFVSIRPTVKRMTDENSLLWAAVVFPSVLVFGLCIIFKVLEWSNLSRWERFAKNVRVGLAVVWLGVMLWSILSLALYRAPDGHGPDMVGQEVSGFVGPLFIAVLLSLGFAAAHHRQASFRRFGLLGATGAIAFIEIVVYCAAIVP